MRPIKFFSALMLMAISSLLISANSGDTMSELGIETSKLRQDALLNLKEPKWFYFNVTAPMRQMAHRLPEASRAATVRSLGKIVRAYVESTAFRQAWLQDLRSYYPYDEGYTDENLAQQEQDQETEKSALNGQLAAMDQAFAQMDPAMLKMAVQAQISQETQELNTLEGSARTSQTQHIASLKKMLALSPAEFKKQYLATLKQQAQANLNQQNTTSAINKEQLAQQRQQKAAFDAHADFRPLLKERLQDFIDLSEMVDFEARLVPMGRRQTFANPVYERKPAEWKFLYRLGKEPVTEARLFAKQWLADLP